MKKIKIAIDGPAASGKSTTAKIIAQKLGYLYIDTGAMYRALTLAIIKAKVDISNVIELKKITLSSKIELKQSDSQLLTFLNGKNVSNEIRMPEINQIISFISAYPEIRKIMVEKQRKLAEHGGIVMDGRDIGTVVLPDAEVKIYMEAKLFERAKRRFNELQENGIKLDLSDIKNEIKNRDKIDSSRVASPLKPAENAIIIDTSNLTIEEQTDKCLELIQNYFECGSSVQKI
jgi:cytidylate kinase